MSSTSPQANTPGASLLSSVSARNSAVRTPPAVTCALSKPETPVTGREKDLITDTSASSGASEADASGCAPRPQAWQSVLPRRGWSIPESSSSPASAGNASRRACKSARTCGAGYSRKKSSSSPAPCACPAARESVNAAGPETPVSVNCTSPASSSSVLPSARRRMRQSARTPFSPRMGAGSVRICVRLGCSAVRLWPSCERSS